MNDPRFRHLSFLDGIRTVSIVMVLVWHARGPCTRRFVGWFEPWVGVDAFFVLSGFLITSLLVQERRDRGFFSLGEFYARRALRIFPAYVVFLGTMLLYYGRPALRPLEMAALYLNNYDHAFGWGYYASFPGGRFPAIAPVWSLCIEEQFYLLWPLSLAWLGRHDDAHPARLPRALVLTLGAIAAVIAWKAALLVHDPKILTPRLYYPFETRADAVLIGCAAALAWAHAPSRARIRSGLAGRFTPAILVIALGCATQNVRIEEERWLFGRLMAWVVSLPAYSLLVATLILALVVQPSSGLAKVLSNRLVAWIGRISYGIYLWHCFALEETKRLEGVLARALPSSRPVLLELVTLAVGVVASLALACASHYLIEQPFLRLKRRFQAPRPAASCARAA